MSKKQSKWILMSIFVSHLQNNNESKTLSIQNWKQYKDGIFVNEWSFFCFPDAHSNICVNWGENPSPQSIAMKSVTFLPRTHFYVLSTTKNESIGFSYDSTIS